MSAAEHMKRALKKLGLYRLDGGTQVDFELDSYAFGLDGINGEIEGLYRECFVRTAKSYGLEMREKLFGSVRTDMDLGKRRERIIYYMSQLPGEWDLNKTVKAFEMSGFDITITEDPENERVRLGGEISYVDFLKLRELVYLADSVLPAQLDYYLDLPEITWNSMEGFDYNFDQWDYLNLHWELMETY